MTAQSAQTAQTVNFKRISSQRRTQSDHQPDEVCHCIAYGRRRKIYFQNSRFLTNPTLTVTLITVTL